MSKKLGFTDYRCILRLPKVASVNAIESPGPNGCGHAFVDRSGREEIGFLAPQPLYQQAQDHTRPEPVHGLLTGVGSREPQVLWFTIITLQQESA
ncbi:MAG: hypothetical protein EBE86_006560 [Hormoscilla sp. GUM202]|nr:hypothetical protein [Hormoscilla sp. SP12CHS1]MBO1347064.1 hypothetical protein [Hormoscilla sp. GUM202]